MTIIKGIFFFLKNANFLFKTKFLKFLHFFKNSKKII